MASFEEIDGARKLLGLGEAATLKEIKQAYRGMAFRYHPDRAGEDPERDDEMKKLNRAYKLLTEYCARHKYTFREEDVARTYREDEYLRRYAYGWFDGI
ncbi:MAG: J domain-containing protein [Dehalococcoidia bacterium]|jgi:curved DNA-binding protein|nr:J domain-containing protein [Dehalococcoidia bacterium]